MPFLHFRSPGVAANKSPKVTENIQSDDKKRKRSSLASPSDVVTKKSRKQSAENYDASKRFQKRLSYSYENKTDVSRQLTQISKPNESISKTQEEKADVVPQNGSGNTSKSVFPKQKKKENSKLREKRDVKVKSEKTHYTMGKPACSNAQCKHVQPVCFVGTQK